MVGEPKLREKSKKEIVIEKTAMLESQSEVEEVVLLMTESSSKIIKPAS